MNPPEGARPEESTVPGKIPDYIRGSIFVLKDYVQRKDREPIVGLQHVLEYRVKSRPDKSEIKYFCEVCQLDGGVIPMVDHLCGFRHRKLYVAKEYPYVLKALFSTKEEDRTRFMRRMALEIERDEGPKAYKMDPIIRTVSLMNVKSTAAKQSKRKTRWNPEGERQIMKAAALRYLETLTLEDSGERETASRLAEKLSAEAKLHIERLKEEALFPAKVARAQDVAMALMRDVAVERMVQKHIRKLEQRRNAAGVPGASHPDGAYGAPANEAVPAAPWKRPCETPSDPEPRTDQPDEDVEFFKTLMALLAILPEGSPDEPGVVDLSTNQPPGLGLMTQTSAPNESAQDNEDSLMRIAALLGSGEGSASSLVPEGRDGGYRRENRASATGRGACQGPERPAGYSGELQRDEDKCYGGRVGGSHRENFEGSRVESMGFPAKQPPRNTYVPNQLPRNTYVPNQLPRNTYAPNQPPRNTYGLNQPPQNTYAPNQPPRNTYAPNQPPRNTCAPNQPPRNTYAPNQPPRNTYAPNQPPWSTYGPNQPEQSMYGPSEPPRDTCGSSEPPRSTYGPNQPVRNTYGPNQPERSTYGSSEPPRNTYADMCPEPSGMYRREWGDSSNRGGNQQYGDYRTEHAPYMGTRLPPTNRRAQYESFHDNRYNPDSEFQPQDTRPNHGAPSSRSFNDPAWPQRGRGAQYSKRAKLDSKGMVASGRGRPQRPGGRVLQM